VEYSDASVTFPLYKDPSWPGEYFLVDENGNAQYFFGSRFPGNETAFSETHYEYTLGSASSSGNFAKVKTTEEQMSAKCVPYIETVTIAGKITGIRYRFVDPVTKATVSNPDIYIRRIRIHLEDSDIDINPPNIISDYAGEEYSVSTPSSLNPDSITSIEIRFLYKSENPDGIFQNPRPVRSQTTEYRWYFSGTFAEPSDTPGEPGDTPDEPGDTPDEPGNTPGEPGDTPDKPGDTTDESGYVTLPTAEEVQQTKDDWISNHKLTDEIPASFEAVESVNIKTDSHVTFGDDISLNQTSSAIAISQNVAMGGAVVLGTGTLPLVSKSISGLVDLPPVNGFNELSEKYHVIKSFDGGGAIDLLAEYGNRAFDYDVKNQKVILKATIVIIDGPAPVAVADDGIVRPFENDIFGVRLSNDNKYLYIYDGNKDGKATDPIALVAKTNVDENKRNGGGSGGCNAGYGLFGFLLTGLVTRKYRKA
jgi:hypothetical protein